MSTGHRSGAAPAAPTPPATPTAAATPAWRTWLQQGLAFGTLIVLVLFFWAASPRFLTWSNISGILLATAVIGILALGTTFIITTAGIDLSVGTGMTLCSVMTGIFAVDMGLPMVVAVILGILSGGVMGLVNGLNVAVLGLPPFIATLAMMMVAQGLALVISGVSPIYFHEVPGFQSIALGTLIPGLPNAVLIMFVVAALAWFLLSKTILGRITVAIGSNEEAARLSGIDTRRWKLIIYVVGGLFTGVAGVVMAARLGSAQPQLGVGYELQAIAAVIIGGTSLMGGRGSIVGTLIGALIMSVLINGLRILSIQTEWQNVVLGVVIALAVFFDTLRNKRAS
ncbi:ABC transporter permease [Brachybacterium sp. AOP43-C2-M15]|uniref:ABC transporter permease n=1 Tax=Brachybacterium sp. AOP43-C2-M15 TaxID=3457661 RepID=UPI0040333870